MRRGRLLRTEWAGLLFFSVLVIIILMAAAALRYKSPRGQDPPKITDWMEAWGTIGGVLAGLLAALAAALLLRHEWRQARLDHEAQREEQAVRHAEHVTWYLKESRTGQEGVRKPSDGAELTHPSVPDWLSDAVLVLLNSSDNCIYRVVASIPEFLNYPEDLHYLERRGLGTIPPGRTEIQMPMRGMRSEGSAGTRTINEIQDNLPVEYVQFRDPAGRTWRRFRDGVLTEVTDAGEYPAHHF